MRNLSLLMISFISFMPTLSYAKIGKGAKERNVILITWDGVRLSEFLNEPDKNLSSGVQAPTLPYLWSTLAPTGQIYGDPRQGGLMTVANTTMVSLPAYQSIMTGTTEWCFGNECGRVQRSTFVERLVRDELMPRNAVAVIGSWEEIANAAEHTPETAFVNAGLVPLNDVMVDQELDQINKEQSENLPPWEGARLDRYTHQHSLRYLKAHRPRFMFIAYNDSDEWGHKGNYPMYVQTLRQYDAWLAEIIESLKAMGDYGKNTCLLVTTDHGRGNGSQWTTHSNGVLESARILMYAGCPLDDGPSPFLSNSRVTHLDIRPTVESLLGLAPHECTLCGKALSQEQ